MPFLRFRPSFLTVPVLVVLAAASAILFHSLEVDRFAERGRQERFMRNAAMSVVDDLGAELFTMYSAFAFDLESRRKSGEALDRQALADAIGRYRAQARFPKLLQGVACLVRKSGGGFVYSTWSDLGWASDLRPDWADDLQLPDPTDTLPPLPRIQSPFSLERPVLTLYLKIRSDQPGDVVAVSLRFNPQVILEQVVPTLVRQRFAESEEAQTYRAAVRNLSLSAPGNTSTSDWVLPLLPWTPFQGWFEYYLNRLKNLEGPWMKPGPPPNSTGWCLVITRLPEGLEAEMTRLLWRNIGLAVAFFLVLTVGFLGLYIMARQARNRALQERTFLALVSHELKTPLAVVRSLADNLARGIGTDEARAREYGVVLKDESDRLSRMVGNVLGLTAIQGGISARDRCAVDLGALVSERLNRQETQGPTIEVIAQIHPGLPLVQAHPAALAAAVDNLVGNAFRHGTTGPGPHRVKIVVEPRIWWGIRGVELLVEDNGPGFTKAEGRSFRRPFRRGRQAEEAQLPGGGVGLSLVRTTATALGGTLRWHSSPGKGARFLLWLREFKS